MQTSRSAENHERARIPDWFFPNCLLTDLGGASRLGRRLGGRRLVRGLLLGFAEARGSSFEKPHGLDVIVVGRFKRLHGHLARAAWDSTVIHDRFDALLEIPTVFRGFYTHSLLIL